MLPKHTKKYKTIKRPAPMRIPMTMSVHMIMARTSIPYSKLRKTNSLLIYWANATFQVKSIQLLNFTKPVLPFYFIHRKRRPYQLRWQILLKLHKKILSSFLPWTTCPFPPKRIHTPRMIQKKSFIYQKLIHNSFTFKYFCNVNFVLC